MGRHSYNYGPCRVPGCTKVLSGAGFAVASHNRMHARRGELVEVSAWTWHGHRIPGTSRFVRPANVDAAKGAGLYPSAAAAKEAAMVKRQATDAAWRAAQEDRPSALPLAQADVPGRRLYEVPVYDGRMKVFRILNVQTGTVYSTEFVTVEAAQDAIDDGAERAGYIVTRTTLADIGNALDFVRTLAG